jgi:hypothetical protein
MWNSAEKAPARSLERPNRDRFEVFPCREKLALLGNDLQACLLSARACFDAATFPTEPRCSPCAGAFLCYSGGFNSPLSQPTASDCIGSVTKVLVTTSSHFGHSNDRFSIFPAGLILASIIRVWQRGQAGRSMTLGGIAVGRLCSMARHHVQAGALPNSQSPMGA